MSAFTKQRAAAPESKQTDHVNQSTNPAIALVIAFFASFPVAF
jgi:hypothetical protein